MKYLIIFSKEIFTAFSWGGEFLSCLMTPMHVLTNICGQTEVLKIQHVSYHVLSFFLCYESRNIPDRRYFGSLGPGRKMELRHS